MKQTILIAPVAIALLVSPLPSHAWWGNGHAVDTSCSVQSLPDEMKPFFQTNIIKISKISGNEPYEDLWDKSMSRYVFTGTHYIDIDQTITGLNGHSYAADFAGGAGLSTMPRTYADAVARYGQMYLDCNGTAPWLVSDYVDQMAKQMKTAATARDWMNMQFTAGKMAHFVADLHNPMHLATNYNGQLTSQDGLHARYEGQMLERGSVNRYPEIVAAIKPGTPTLYSGTTGVTDAVFNRIAVDYPKNDAILAADLTCCNQYRYWPYDEVYSDNMWNALRTVTLDSFQNSSEMIAHCWYTAWDQAGRPTLPLLANAASVQVADIGPSGTSSSGWSSRCGVQGAENGTAASYSVLRFSMAEIKAGFDAAFGAGQWSIGDVTLDMQLRSSSNTGQIKVFYSSDDTTSITSGTALRYSDGASPLGVDVAQDSPIGSYLFDSTTVPASSVLLDWSSLAQDILHGRFVTLVLWAGDSNLIASYAGSSVDAAPLLAVTAIVPEPTAIVGLLTIGTMLLIRRPRLRKS